jgi:hypothetical protein
MLSSLNISNILFSKLEILKDSYKYLQSKNTYIELLIEYLIFKTLLQNENILVTQF